MVQITNKQWEKVFTMRDNFAKKVLMGKELFEDQKKFSNKIIKSVILQEGQTLISQRTRQSGKTTEIARITTPFLLYFYFPIIESFGLPMPQFFNIGFFGPQEQQAKTDFDLLKDTLRRLSKEVAPLIFEEFSGDTIKIARGKYPPRMIYAFTASATSHPESKTLNLIFLEEAQDLIDLQVDKAILPMGASCVCKDTLVYDVNGIPINIQDVDDCILGTNDNYDVVLNNVTNKGTTTKPCYKITTNSGRMLKCSYDHPIMVKNRKNRQTEFKTAYDLKIGTQIAIGDKIDRFGWDSMFNPRLIGMLIGDGSYRRGGMVRYCSCDHELLDYVKKDYDFKSYNTYITKQNKIFEDGTIKGLCGELKKLGIYGQTGKQKTLPDNIHEYNEDVLLELLGGLYDTDGCVTIEDNRRGRIYLDSCSKVMLEEVFIILEKFGIHSRIYHSKTKSDIVKKEGSVWRLVVSERESVLRFHEKIKLLIRYKQLKLNKLHDILQKHKPKRQKNMLNVYFERITNIEDIGIQTVYNLTANDTHTYLANGIITHNTNATAVWIGVAGYKKCRFWELGETLPAYNKVIVTYKKVLKEHEKRFKITKDPFYNNYRKYIDKTIREIGEDSPEFKTQYMMEWQLEKGQFITYDRLMECEADYHIRKRYPKYLKLYAGIDWGKMHDSTILTIINRAGEIVFWEEWNGDDYASQIEDIVHLFVSRFPAVEKVHCDATGNQDMGVDQLRASCKKAGLKVSVIPFKFNKFNKDTMYKNLFTLMTKTMKGKQVVTPNFIKFPTEKSMKYMNPVYKERFIKQFCDLQKEIKQNCWHCAHPEGPNYHDDYTDSIALCCLSFNVMRTVYKPVMA